MADIVYLSSAPPFPFGTMARDVPRAFILYTGVDELNLGTHEGKGYLLKLEALDPTLDMSVPAPPYPFGTNDRRGPRAWTSRGRTAAAYIAATGNASRSSLPTDTPANTWVPGKLSGGFNYEITLFSGADPLRAGSATIGVLTLDDPDGELDALRVLAWDGASLQLRRGDPEGLFSAWSTVANLTTAGLLYDLRRKEIRLRDLGWRLESELHGIRYAGTGGADGDSILAGRIKPYAIGQVNGITPVQINDTALIYQVSCTSVLAIDTVADGVAPLGFSADYATFAELEAATIAPGYFATCLALGLFRLGSVPVYIITADVRGDNDTINGVAYPSTRAAIARRIATGRGAVRLRDPEELDTSAFSDLDGVQTATLGYFWDGEFTKAAALKEVMDGCLGWSTVRLDGRLAVGQLEDPANVTPWFSLSYPADAGDVEVRVGEPAMVDYRQPSRATYMGYARNYTRLAVNQIAGSVTPAAALAAQTESRYVTSANQWVESSYAGASVVKIEGGFANESDALLECKRIQKLLEVPRESFEIEAVIDPFADVSARVVSVLNANRLGLGASKSFFSSGVAANGNGKLVLRLWG